MAFGDPQHRGHELVPERALTPERLTAAGREPVVAAAPLAGLFQPAAGDQAAGFEPAEQRIERGDAIAELAAGALLDQPADFIAVPRPAGEQRQHQELGAALLQLAAQHRPLGSLHLLHRDISLWSISVVQTGSTD